MATGLNMNILAEDIDKMLAGMSAYSMRPRDALHWAVMQRNGLFDLVSNDAHFDRIPSIRRHTLQYQSMIP